MTENYDDAIKRFLIEKPEMVFARKNLSYRTSEVADIIGNYVELAANPRPVYTRTKDLLTALLRFRYQTPSEGMFADVRNQVITDQELLEIMQLMLAAIGTYKDHMTQENNPTDQKIMQSALTYVEKSLAQRMASLPKSDRLHALAEKIHFRFK